LLNISNDVLDYSKLSSRQVELKQRNFEVTKLIGDIMRNFELTALEKDIDLFASVDVELTGISEEALDRLFLPFSQADASTTRHYGGTETSVQAILNRR